ncbi:MAG: class II glutamine amidotransferase [Nitrospiraceae bacterium]|nr:class II glutamine amidotransferase [Nitrospiraceae bacterium]
MCRIIGFCGNSNAGVTALIQALLLAEEKGNPHGTGLAVKTLSGNNLVRKKGVRARTFLLQGHANFLWDKKYRYALGHVRFKTAGEQSDRNSHPFGVQVRDKWHFGIHNGIIGKTRELAHEFGVKPAAVDSETFWRCVARLQNQGEDVITAIEKVTDFISDKGDFAFAYMTEREIFFWRNDERPLAVFDAREHRMGRFIASTKEMFTKAWEWACPGLDIRKVTYFEATPYRLYRLSADTSPKYEVDAVKDLEHRAKTSMSVASPSRYFSHGGPDSFFGRYSGRQSGFWDEGFGGEGGAAVCCNSGNGSDLYGVRDLSDTEITDAIFNTGLELDLMSRRDPLYGENKEYLEALQEERRRRNA